MCNCKNVNVWTYKNQVGLVVPDNIKILKNTIDPTPVWIIFVDKCLKKEIKYLRSQWIRTTWCCCWHNKIHWYIGVIPEDIDKMLILWYNVCPNPSRPYDNDSFYPKYL